MFGLGCGSADEGSGGADGDATAARQAGGRCLQLLRAGRFADSVDACTEALRESPTSEEIAAALARARQGIAEAAERVADAARETARRAEDAAEAAAEQAEEIAEAAKQRADEFAEAAEEQAEAQRAAAEQAAESLQDDVDALGR